MSDETFFGTYFAFHKGDSAGTIAKKTLLWFAVLVDIVCLILLVVYQGRIEPQTTAQPGLVREAAAQAAALISIV